MAENYIGVPDAQFNSIDYYGDIDTNAVWLTAGQSYDFDVYGWGETSGNGDGVFDPTLTVTGQGQYAFDDDGGAFDYDSHIDFTAGTDGYYTLSVAGFGSEQGNYTLYTSYDDGVLPV
jgi:hypothetical protein